MIWIIITIIVVLVIFVIASYNGLVKSRMQTKEAWSQIDVQLKRRNDLLPNLIETVKGYAKYEGSTLEKVAELRNQVAAATSPAEAMRASDELMYLLLILGFGIVVQLQIPLFEHALKPYVNKVAA